VEARHLGVAVKGLWYEDYGLLRHYETMRAFAGFLLWMDPDP
jgi:hypothetical protein